MRFWVVFRSERAVSTIFPPYIMPNGTYERKIFFYDTLPLIIHSFSDKVTTEEANTSMKDLLCGLYSSLVGDGRKQGRGHD